MESVSVDVETVESAMPEGSLTEGKRTSGIWEKDFTFISGMTMEDRIPRGKCNYCNKVLKAKGQQGTSNLKRHLEICPKRKNRDVGQMLITAQGRLACREISYDGFVS